VYVPEPFREERIDVLHAAIRQAGLATLVSVTADGLIASHVPLLLDPEPAPYGALLGHLAGPPTRKHAAQSARRWRSFWDRTPISRPPGTRRSGRLARSSRPGTTSRFMPMGRWNSSTILSMRANISLSLPTGSSEPDRARGHRATHRTTSSQAWSGELSAFG
jgi:hypothetical protein